MVEKTISLSTLKTLQSGGMVLVPLKKWQRMEKENQKMREMQDAMQAIIEGERDIREGNIRPFKDFLAELHAKD